MLYNNIFNIKYLSNDLRKIIDEATEKTYNYKNIRYSTTTPPNSIYYGSICYQEDRRNSDIFNQEQRELRNQYTDEEYFVWKQIRDKKIESSNLDW